MCADAQGQPCAGTFEAATVRVIEDSPQSVPQLALMLARALDLQYFTARASSPPQIIGGVDPGWYCGDCGRYGNGAYEDHACPQPVSAGVPDVPGERAEAAQRR